VLPVPVHLLPDDDVAHYLKQPVLRVGGLWSAELKRAPLSSLEQGLKRTLDIIGAGVGLLALSPLMILTAILIKLDSPGPILFMQRRNGFNGRTFRICKFRTMKVLEDGPTIQQAIRNDPRVTRVGRWIRQGSIDELPQLFNVLSGDMSLVGPRPHPVALDTKYTKMIAAYAFRYHMKPGITGWAQINGYRGETQIIDLMAKRVDCDLWYIKNWSLWLDIGIILRTLTGELKFWRSHAY
jgi:undecaprenyl-phosphate galactose phosphotransferase/putative colanic acid biosynthesis UDP-glucose lipid carrier transferase